MKYEYFIDSNNITYKEGDTLIVDFSNYFENFKSIEDIQFDFDPIEAWDVGHNIYMRWSYDVAGADISNGKPHVVWSSWIQITSEGLPVPAALTIYNKLFRSELETFDLQFKLVRRGTASGARAINKITILYEPGVLPEEPELSLYPTNSQGCKATCSPAMNFGSGILINTTSGLFRPYDVMKPAQSIYKQMACAASEMFGHCVRYFKTQAKVESADPVLKEYSLYEVTDVKDIKILIPDNTLPDNAIRFMPYDMDFGDGLECHIVREHFERAFGPSELPEQKDYIYFPLIDRIFEVNSAYLYRDFMGMEAYYKVMLYKWQDKLNVMRENPEIDKYVNDLHDSLDDILQPQIQKEFLNTTKPTQYTTVAVGGYDYVRSHINDNLIIVDKDLSNYFTVISKNYYDLKSKMNHGDIAVKYKKEINRLNTENTAFTVWFTPKKTAKDKNTYDIILDGYNISESKGILIKINYTNSTASSITVKVNETDYEFTDLPALTNDVWYGMCLNVYNEFKQISLLLWGMKYNPNTPSQNNTTDLLQIYNKTFDFIPQEIKPTDTFYQLRAGTLNMTNIRVWSETIEEEKQSLILNQYIVKEQEYALIIDNAIQPLKLSKEFVR